MVRPALLLLALALGACSDDGASEVDRGPAADLFPHPFDLSSPDAPAAAPDAGQTAATHAALARHWAPTWYQDTDSSNHEGDYIVAYDYDGDTRSDNNWDNLNKAGVDLRAVIYYSVVETQTHWFLLYADFHPQDWDENCQPIPFGPDRCHENDMEGAMVVVEKDGTEHGRFRLLYTEAHNTLHVFTNDAQVTAFHTKSLEGAPVTFDSAATAAPGEHPMGHRTVRTPPRGRHAAPPRPGRRPPRAPPRGARGTSRGGPWCAVEGACSS